MACTTSPSIKAEAIRRAHALRSEAELEVLRAVLRFGARLLGRRPASRRAVPA